MKEQRALPKVTPGTVPGCRAQPMGGKQRGRLLHGLSCNQTSTPLPPGWELRCRRARCFPHSPFHSHRAPHLSAAVSEPAWPPAASPPCRAAAEQRGMPVPLPHCRSGAGSAGESRGTVTLPGHHLPGHPAMVPQQSLGSREVAVHSSAPQLCTHTHSHACAHTCTPAWPADCLPSQRQTTVACESFMKYWR